ncbi:putative xanthine dehydrogenase subunit D XDHasesubunit D, partial [human gut metagenome]
SVKPKLSFYLKMAAESEEMKFHKNHTNNEGDIIITKSLLKKAYDLCKDNNDSILDEKDYIPPKTYPHKICGDLIPGMKEEEFKIHYAYCFVSAGAVVEVDTETGLSPTSPIPFAPNGPSGSFTSIVNVSIS